jgi:hypothetical protein
VLVQEALARWDEILIWGLAATVVMSTVLHGSQGLGLSRLSLPFLVGTLFTSDRSWASIFGFLFYLTGGWLFALIYFLLMAGAGAFTWWVGALIGLIHALFLLTVVLPLMPFFHPRMATEYDGPSAKRRLEPPGFMGLNYGYRTPLTTIVGQMLYGVILGAAL